MITMRPFRRKCRDRHTKAFIHSIITDEVSAFSCLLCHECHDSTEGFDFLDGLCFFHKGINVVHDFKQVDDAVVTVHLSQDGLRNS